MARKGLVNNLKKLPQESCTMLIIFLLNRIGGGKTSWCGDAGSGRCVDWNSIGSIA